MILNSIALGATLAVVSQALPSTTTPTTSVLRRDGSDPADLSWIKNWASVGDSYSAGIGSGAKYGGWGDYFCSRYTLSFPALINTDPRLGSSDGRTFTYWPCSGAVTDGVIKQVNALSDGSQDLITISSGGNDALLSDILNECVFQWLSDADPITSKCDDQLKKAQAVIDSSDFHSKLDKLISAAKKKVKSDGNVYYVGYGQFFGQDSNQCDGVTWAYWYEYGKREFLTQDKRKKMNTLVQNMNKALSDAVGRAGSGVTFIDFDKYYVEGRGRFCEDAYKETSPNRYGLLFYEWYTDDNADETDGLTAQTVGSTDAFTPSLVMNGTFEGTINDYVRQTLEKNPSWTKGVANAQGAPPSVDDAKATDEQLAVGYSSSVVPDSYARVFHPRPNGHQLIANLVLYHVQADYAKRLSKDWPKEEITGDTCSATGGASNTSPGPKPSPSCDTHALSGIPYNVFSGSGTGSTDVYGKFCEAVGNAQTKELSWTTDALGEQKSKKLRSVKRTPPPNPSAYDSYSFSLNWKPSSDGSCTTSCKDAFSTISTSPCGHQGGEQNGMTAKGSVDVGCGTYSYEITGDDVPEPEGPPKPTISAQYCFPSDVFGDHGDIQPDFQAEYTGWACVGSALNSIKKDDPSTFVNFNTTTNGVPYKYTIVWEDNCESSVSEMNQYQPIEGNDANCVDMMQNNYKKCNNGGIGGSISAGCVKYEFRASFEESP